MTDRPKSNGSNATMAAVPDAESVLLMLAEQLLAGNPERATITKPASERAGMDGDRQLRRAEARYRTLVEQIPAVTFMGAIDEGLGEIYVSPQIESLLGYTAAEWIDNPILWYQRLHPEDKERWNAEFSQTVAFGRPFKSVYRFLAKDGRVVWIHGEARIVRDEDGRPLFIQGIGFDITELKRSEEELRRQTDELKRSNADLEQFAFIASHDLQEPLRKVAAFTELLASQYKGKLDDDADKYIGYILDGAARMRALVKDVLAYSRVGRDEDTPLEETDLNDIISDVLVDEEEIIRQANVQIVSDPLPTLTVHRVEFRQLFQNLITNAIKFRNAHQPEVRITAQRLPDAWHFRIADNGIGIDPLHLEKIFTIFKRLHSRTKYAGTGIGLAICKKIVERHEGRIWVESQVGTGSTFNFTIPLYTERRRRAELASGAQTT